MQLRPTQAQHFEVFTPRQQTVYALQALAASGAVQLDANPTVNASLEMRKTAEAVTRFEELARPFRTLLPAARPRASALPVPPDALARHAIDILEEWLRDIDPVIARRAELSAERDNLLRLQEYLDTRGDAPRDLGLLAHPDGLLHKGLYACPLDGALDADIEPLFHELHAGRAHRFLLLVGLPEQRDAIDAAVATGTCVRIEVPSWLADAHGDRGTQIASRLAAIDRDLAALVSAETHLSADPRIGESLADIALLKWYLRQAAAITEDEKFCQISGWTTLDAPQAIEGLLERAHLQGFVRMLTRPVASMPPTQTLDTWWARPFAPFIQLYGTPGEHEVDPSLVLVFMVPLLFGYMFPDVGHGAVLVLLSAVLYRRWPEGRFLVPCGLSAMLFGWVFGEVFGFHDIITPLWLKPLEDPLRVLLAPLAFGIGVILLGLLFSAIEHYWRREFLIWCLLDAAVLTIYVAGLSWYFYPAAAHVTVAGLLWYLTGCLIAARIDPRYPAGRSLGRLLEGLFQLAVNTLSFVRVGAFALAHAGISTAVLMVADLLQDPAGFWLVLIVLQVAVLSLEALIVYVQTTRLVFFEFYIRFLRAEGRVFRPLPPPGGESHNQYIASS